MKDQLLGKKLAGGRFQVIGDKPLGKGGFATVYLGIQTRLRRKVAIKVLSETASEDKDLVKRFIRESKVVAMFEHPNIIKIIDSGSEDGIHYFVMNYLPSTLQQILRRPENQRGLPLDKGLKITKDIASALHYMHNHKIIKEFIHRDIKPGNIMFDESGNAILTDFGLVKGEQFSQLTLKNSVMGTPKYMAPEQVRGDELDHRTDIYSLGIVFYEMLVGQPPFTGDPLSICHKQVAVAATLPHTLKQEIPETLEIIIMKCIEKDVEKRYQSAADLLADLEEWENYTRRSHRSAPTMKAKLPEDLSKTVVTGDKTRQKPEYESSFSAGVTPTSKKTKSTTESEARKQPWIPKKRTTIEGDKGKPSTKIKWVAFTMAGLFAIFLYLVLSSRLAQQQTKGTLFIDSNPSGATVTIDGQTIPEKTPIILADYDLKTYLIRIDLRDYESWSDSVVLDRHDTSRIKPTLRALFSATSSSQKDRAKPVIEKEQPAMKMLPSFGSLAIRSNPAGAKIYIDNILQSKVTNCEFEKLEPKSYTIKLILDGYQPLDTVAYVLSGQQASFSRNLSPIPIMPKKDTGRVSISIVNKSNVPFRGLVLVDGKLFKDKTGEDMEFSGEIELPIGPHRIAVSKFGYGAEEGIQLIKVSPDSIIRLTFTLIKKQK